MNERTEGTDPLEEGGVGSAAEGPHGGPVEATVADRFRARLRSPFSGLFSLRLFVLVLALATAGMVLSGAVIPFALGGAAGLLGIAAVGFAVGLADAAPRYLELLLSGAVASGLGALFDHLLVTALGLGVPVVAMGVGAGALAGVVGHYLGRDLREGLTRSV